MKRKTELEKLFMKLSALRRKSGPMQALATQEVYWLRKICSHYQYQLEWARDRTNMQARKIYRQQKLIEFQRKCIDEYLETMEKLREELRQVYFNIELQKNLALSPVKGLDL